MLWNPKKYLTNRNLRKNMLIQRCNNFYSRLIRKLNDGLPVVVGANNKQSVVEFSTHQNNNTRLLIVDKNKVINAPTLINSPCQKLAIDGFKSSYSTNIDTTSSSTNDELMIKTVTEGISIDHLFISCFNLILIYFLNKQLIKVLLKFN
jgi:hypothetical protein